MAKRSKKKKADHPAVSSSLDGLKDHFPKSVFRVFISSARVPFLLAVLIFLVYLPSLKSDFVYDARQEILKEGFITSISNLPAVLSLKVLGMSHLMLGPRPGQLLYLMLIATICGKEPFGYHLASNLLHATNVALLFVLLRRLMAKEVSQPSQGGALRAQIAAAAVTLVFALHPVAVESVAEVSFSSSLLVTFFTLLTLLAATAFQLGNSRLALLVLFHTGIVGTGDIGMGLAS